MKQAASFTYPSTLEMEEICSSQSSVDFYRNARCHTIEDRTLQLHTVHVCQQNILQINVFYTRRSAILI
jgi:hypothetical protein